MEEEHQPFVRISWKEALEILQNSLHDKYGAKGNIMLMKKISYEGVYEFYDSPDYVDIYLREK